MKLIYLSNFASIFSLAYPAEHNILVEYPTAHGKHKDHCSLCLCTVTLLLCWPVFDKSNQINSIKPNTTSYKVNYLNVTAKLIVC